jgi:hypothetical protein
MNGSRLVYHDSQAKIPQSILPLQETPAMQSPLFLAAIFTLSLATQPLFGQQAPAPAGQTTPQAQSGARPRHPQTKPVNLKVLPKNIAREDLVKIMRSYAGALGIECNFCHMIQMTQTINEQYMTQVHDPDAMPEDKHVTCGTCHRGHTMPEHFVLAAEPRHHPSDDDEGAQAPQ